MIDDVKPVIDLTDDNEAADVVMSDFDPATPQCSSPSTLHGEASSTDGELEPQRGGLRSNIDESVVNSPSPSSARRESANSICDKGKAPMHAETTARQSSSLSKSMENVPTAALSADPEKANLPVNEKLLLVRWVRAENNSIVARRLTVSNNGGIWNMIKSNTPSKLSGVRCQSYKSGTMTMTPSRLIEKYEGKIASDCMDECLELLLDEAYGEERNVKKVWRTGTVFV